MVKSGIEYLLVKESVQIQTPILARCRLRYVEEGEVCLNHVLGLSSTKPSKQIEVEGPRVHTDNKGLGEVFIKENEVIEVCTVDTN